MAKSVEVAIIGGGIMGASIAYHLAKRGMRDIVIFEREEALGTGATGKCAGGGSLAVLDRGEHRDVAHQHRGA